MSGLVEMKMDEVNDLMVEGLKRVKRQTNADRIRSMTDEELAEWMVHKTEGNGFKGYEQSVLAWLKWLKSPAEKGKE